MLLYIILYTIFFVFIMVGQARILTKRVNKPFSAILTLYLLVLGYLPMLFMAINYILKR